MKQSINSFLFVTLPIVFVLTLVSMNARASSNLDNNDALIQAYNEADRMTQEVYNQCLQENEENPSEALNCESEYLGDIEN